MKVRELIQILDDFYPEDEVTFLTLTHRRMQILGLNRQDMEKNSCITFDVDWSVMEGKAIETELEKAAREEARRQKKFDHLVENAKDALLLSTPSERVLIRKKIIDKPMDKRTDEDLAMLEALGKRGTLLGEGASTGAGRKPKKAKKATARDLLRDELNKETKKPATRKRGRPPKRKPKLPDKKNYE